MSLKVISDSSQKNYMKERRKSSSKDGEVQSIPITEDIKKKFSENKSHYASVRDFMQGKRTN